jgi:hypothetical protein
MIVLTPAIVPPFIGIYIVIDKKCQSLLFPRTGRPSGGFQAENARAPLKSLALSPGATVQFFLA